MKKKGIVILLVLAAAAAAFLMVRHLSRSKDDGTMLLSGNVEVTEVNVGFKIAGRVIERLVDEGFQVRTGDVIARLDRVELETVVSQSRASMREAATKLEELMAGSRSQEIEQARSGVSGQDAELQKVKNEFDRAQVLYKNGAISASQFDAAQAAYDARKASYVNAREALSLTKEGPRKEDVLMAKHRLELAKAALETSEARLKDTVIYAPLDGVVLRKNVEAGETVAAGTPIVTLGDLAKPWIKVYVREEMMPFVKLGQKARITVDGKKDKVYEGEVSYISSEAEFTPKTVQTPEERVKLVFGVKVRAKNEHGDLKPGMPADVRILVKP